MKRLSPSKRPRRPITPPVPEPASLQQALTSFSDAANRFSDRNAVVHEVEPLYREDRFEDGLLGRSTVSVKDIIAVEGWPLSCASHVLEGYVSPYHATAVERILDAGGIVVARTNHDEFAMGSSTEHSTFGAAKHPSDPERVPGGSSGGSAVAVALEMSGLALGSDTSDCRPRSKGRHFR